MTTGAFRSCCLTNWNSRQPVVSLV